MKLKDLLKTLDQHYVVVDFEIIESTYPEEMPPQGILTKYPYAADYEVIRITPVIKSDPCGVYGYATAFEASLFIEVSNGGIS